MLSRKEYIQKRFKEIIEAKENNNISVFIGAGVSKLSGSLTWNELIDEMMQDLGIIEIKEQQEFYKSYTSMAIAQMYEEKFGVNTYVSFINEKLGVNLSENKVIKRIIQDLKPQNFITTNYDELIENELIEMGLINNYDIIKEDCDFSKSKVNKKIVKMHGSLDKNNMVLKETDYLEYSENFKLIETTVKSIIAGNKVIFFGYSLQDNNVKQIINWIKTLTNNSSNMPILFLVNGPIINKSYKREVDKVENKIKLKTLSVDEINYYKKIGVDIIQFHELEEVFNKMNYIEKMSNNENFEYAYMTFFDYLSYVEEMKYMSAHEKTKLLYNDLVEITKDKYIRLEDCNGIFKKYGLSLSGDIVKINDEKLLEVFKSYIKSCNENEKKMIISIIEFIYNRAGRFMNFEIPQAVEKEYNLKSNIKFSNKHIEMISNRVQEKNRIKDYLRNAYYCFYNGEIDNARELYKKIEKVSKDRKNIFFYIVAVINEYVCNRIKNRTNGIKQKEELNMLLENLPGEIKNKYSFINEIIDFKITKKQFKYYKNLVQNYNEVYTEKSIVRYGNCDFIELIDLYNCIKENYLLIDIFSDVKNIFKIFTEGEIIRYLYKAKYRTNNRSYGEIFKFDSFDISSEMNIEKLIWVLEYGDLNFIRDNFNVFIDYNLGEYENNEIVNYTLRYIKYLVEMKNNYNYIFISGATVDSKITSAVCFLQSFSLNTEQLNELLKLTSKCKSLKNELVICIINILHKFKEQGELNKNIKNILSKLCYKEIKLILDGKHDNKISKIYNFIKYNDVKINKKECNEVFNDYIIDDKNCELFFQFMQCLYNSSKMRVLEYCNKKLNEEINMETISEIVKYDLPIDISKFDSFIEAYFEDDYHWTNTHEGKNGLIAYGHSRDMTMYYIECMLDKLTQRQREIIISKEKMYKFYFDYENFEYNNFEAQYILDALPNFILKVTENEERKDIIVNKIALAINETSNPDELNMFIKILRVINSRNEKYYYL